MPTLLAVDIGAESGRAILGRLSERSITVQEVHRFPNKPVRVRGTLYWDILKLYDEVLTGMQRAARATEEPIESVGIDTWGVDFALLDRRGQLLGNPVHYRDRRTEGMMDAVLQRIPKAEIYQRTGIQFMPINTLYQLYALVVQQDPQLEQAHTFLTMPDLLHYWLTGEAVCEFTNATTTQCYDPRAGDWARELLAQLGIPAQIFPEIRSPGTTLGNLDREVAEATGLLVAKGVLPAAHDTGSAVAAVPFTDPKAAYISSGTWSLVGVETPEPVINEQGLQHNFTNEGGVGGRFRLLKNVMGLWLLQESRRTWAAQGNEWSYDELMRMAQDAPPFRALIDPDEIRFLPPGDMPARIQAFCRETAQPVPQSPGEIVRCILESLALKYRQVIDLLEQVCGWHIPVVHIVGGGVQNRWLCQATADATGRPVLAGPVEATAVGNLLVQAMGLGYLNGLDEVRELVRRAFSPTLYEPRDTHAWHEAYEKFTQFLTPNL
ncbi:MAG: rhamnulokinase [Fimbriimonadales bacterium]|nr:rhamnulokinase [Fimbriimonadales bacterium]